MVRYWLISGTNWQTCGFVKTYGNTIEENGFEISKGKYYRLRKARINQDKETLKNGRFPKAWGRGEDKVGQS